MAFRSLALSGLCLLLVSVAACTSGSFKRIPTGVERIDDADGSIRLVATGMASQKAIDKDMIAMMQSTCREAARLLLMAELEKPAYSKIRPSFEVQDVEFIERGAYCKMTSLYRPPVVPEKKPAQPSGSDHPEKAEKGR